MKELRIWKVEFSGRNSPGPPFGGQVYNTDKTVVAWTALSAARLIEARHEHCDITNVKCLGTVDVLDVANINWKDLK